MAKNDYSPRLDAREPLSLQMRQQTWAHILVIALPLALAAWGGAYILLRQTAVDSAENAVASYMDRRGYSDLARKVLDTPSYRQLVLSALPIGTVVGWPGEKPPEGWALCIGQPIDSGWDTAGLRAVLKSTYGGDRLPDYRGVFLRGLDLGANIDADPKREIGSKQEHSTARPRAPFSTAGTEGDGAHTHQIKANGIGASKGQGVGDTRTGHNEFMNVWGNGTHSHTIASGGDAETRPVNVAINWIIKVR